MSNILRGRPSFQAIAATGVLLVAQQGVVNAGAVILNDEVRPVIGAVSGAAVDGLGAAAVGVGNLFGWATGGLVGTAQEAGASEASLAGLECHQRPETGTWVLGSDHYRNYPGAKVGDSKIGSWTIEDAGNGMFWVRCAPPAPKVTVSPTAEPTAPKVTTSTTPTPVVRPTPQTIPPSPTLDSLDADPNPDPSPTTEPEPTTTTKKPIEVDFVPYDDGAEGGKSGKEGEDAVVYNVVEGVPVDREVGPSEPEKENPEEPVVPRPPTVPATAATTKNNFSDLVADGTGIAEASTIAPTGAPSDFKQSATEQPKVEVPKSAETTATPEQKIAMELREFMDYAHMTGSADRLIDYIKLSKVFFPVTEGVPEVGGPDNPTRRMPSSDELGGVTIYNFDKDAPIKERLADANTIAAALLTADTYQRVIHGDQRYAGILNSCIRFGDFSALNGHQTHDGNEVDISSQMNCQVRTDPGDGPFVIYAAGNDEYLDGGGDKPPTNPVYERELTASVIEHMRGMVIGNDGQPLIITSIFNDPELVSRGLTTHLDHHAAHWHAGTSPVITSAQGRPLKNYADGGGVPLDVEDAPSDEAMQAAPSGGVVDLPVETSTIPEPGGPEELPEPEAGDKFKENVSLANSEPVERTVPDQIVFGSSGIPLVGDAESVVTGELIDPQVAVDAALANTGGDIVSGVSVDGGGTSDAAWRALAAQGQASRLEAAMGQVQEPTVEDLQGIKDVGDFYDVFAPSIKSELHKMGVADDRVVGYIVAQLFAESWNNGKVNELALEFKNIGGQKTGGEETRDNKTVWRLDGQDGMSEFVVWDNFNGDGGFFDEWFSQRRRVSPAMFQAVDMGGYVQALVNARYATNANYGNLLKGVYEGLKRRGYA